MIGDGAFLAFAQGTLPDYRHTPAALPKPADGFRVVLDRTRELGEPEFLPRAGCGGVAAPRVPVPEAAVHEHDGAIPGQDEIRLPR